MSISRDGVFDGLQAVSLAQMSVIICLAAVIMLGKMVQVIINIGMK